MNRLANGNPMPGSEVVAADAAACLAGVSFGNTINVLTAIRTLHETTGISYDVLLDTESIPLELADDFRFTKTEKFVRELIGKLPERSPLRRLLRLDSRKFNRH